MSHNWVLSSRSRERLLGVKPELANTVKRALELSPIDFGVTEGKRSIERQKELVARGLSQTMNSKHLSGNAVDLVAYLSGRVCWEMSAYDELADAMKQAAKETEIAVRWGGAWQVRDIRLHEGTMEDAMNAYIDLRRSEGRRPFLDGPHFELS
jgi:peptidoglycan L-alanyl-D-glutamate endopeptidase CwlK|tara:strand:- start:2504 stop:2962 length:459 start_codon:yes stop_codon:yes gene_type:complete